MSCERKAIGLCGNNSFGGDCAGDCPRLAVAGRLKALAGNQCSVTFCHNVSLEDGDGSEGHLWIGSLTEDLKHLVLDDRLPESLDAQLVAELRRIGTDCLKLADEAEERMEAGLEAVA